MAVGSASGGQRPTNTVINVTRIDNAVRTLAGLGESTAALWLRTWLTTALASWWGGPGDLSRAYPRATCHGNKQIEFPFERHELRVLEAFPGMFTVLDVLDPSGRPV